MTYTELSNVELTLLQIVAEKSQASGYEINKIVIERGFRNWANIGTTSIYKGLEKLKSRELVSSSMNESKTGKGPVPRLFALTEQGYQTLHNSIISALSTTTERDHRFDLGLAGLGFLKPLEVIEALIDRMKMLEQRKSIIQAKLKADGNNNLPLSAKLVFEHPLTIIKNEIEFIESVIKTLKGKLE